MMGRLSNDADGGICELAGGKHLRCLIHLEHGCEGCSVEAEEVELVPPLEITENAPRPEESCLVELAEDI